MGIILYNLKEKCPNQLSTVDNGKMLKIFDALKVYYEKYRMEIVSMFFIYLHLTLKGT